MRGCSTKTYLKNDTFTQQIKFADIIIGNKHDLYESDDQDRLLTFTSHQCGPEVEVIFSEQGIFDLELLDRASRYVEQCPHNDHHNPIETQLNELTIPDSGYVVHRTLATDLLTLISIRFAISFDINRLRLMLRTSILSDSRVSSTQMRVA